jgi:hypothetical protein
MYFADHAPPHFHAEYAEHETKTAIDTLAIISGKLPPRAMGLVAEWARASSSSSSAPCRSISWWDPARDEVAGEQCRSYGAANIMRVPGRLHITWHDDQTLKKPNGDAHLIVTTTIEDPEYLTQPYLYSTHFKRQADATGWAPRPCSAR